MIEQTEKAALITGGSRGIGYELGKLCAQDGYDVVLVARDQARLQRAADELESTWDITTMTLSKDLTRPEAAREIHDEVEARRPFCLAGRPGPSPRAPDGAPVGCTTWQPVGWVAPPGGTGDKQSVERTGARTREGYRTRRDQQTGVVNVILPALASYPGRFRHLSGPDAVMASAPVDGTIVLPSKFITNNRGI